MINSTIIGSSISTARAISPGRKPFRKALKHASSPQIPEFWCFSSAPQPPISLNLADFRCTIDYPVALESGPALDRPIRSRISQKKVPSAQPLSTSISRGKENISWESSIRIVPTALCENKTVTSEGKSSRQLHDLPAA
jgi:hypothetical protein